MSDIQDWINDNFNSRFGWDLNGEWLDVWATTCYYIWFWHNKETHDANYARPPQTWKVISQSINYKHATVMNIMECKKRLHMDSCSMEESFTRVDCLKHGRCF